MTDTEPQERTREGLKGFEDFLLQKEAVYWCDKYRNAGELIELLDRIAIRRGPVTAGKLRHYINEERARRKAENQRLSKARAYLDRNAR